MDAIKKHIEWLPAIIVIIVLGGSLPFKFTDDPITLHIFDVVGQFLGLEFFRTTGAYIIGGVEAVVCILMLIPSLRAFGAALGAGTMVGAISFHLFSPLGVTVRWMEDGEMKEDGTLFYTAVLVLVCCLWLMWRRKQELLKLVGIGGETRPA